MTNITAPVELTTETARQTFTAYQQTNKLWGFFIDEELARFYRPFKTQEAAQDMADEFKRQSFKPQHFTEAWQEAVAWLEERTGYNASDIVNCDNYQDQTAYQNMPPNIKTFEELMHEGSGVRCFAAQIYSFYNTERAITLTQGELRNLTPCSAGHLLDREGLQIILKLTDNYAGW